MIDSPILILKQNIEEYLKRMISNGYSLSTCGGYQKEFNSFLLFIIRRHIDWKDIFTHDTLKDFTKSSPAKKGAAVRGLWQYLFDQKRVPHPIDPPRPSLPDPYEDYLIYYNETRKVRPYQLARIRRVLLAFHDYLERHGIKLSLIRIEEIDAFLAEFFTGFSPNTRGTYSAYIRGFLKYLYDPPKDDPKRLGPPGSRCPSICSKQAAQIFTRP